MKLDMELFRFQKISHMTVVRVNKCSILQNFFTDSSRAGVYFADQVKIGALAEELLKVLGRRFDDRIGIGVESHRHYHDPDSPPTLKIVYSDLRYFPRILAAAPEDPKLARLLWELAVQYKDDEPISRGRKRMADSALEYINRCGISVPEHAHQADCSICANYKPAFPTPSPGEETTQYTISTSDEPAASRSYA
ncbi:hypothetical protein BJ912DRAFT_105172 [Pholiota molesta]|nr:hypothetical protein BJ912DRAFT_105172 [Pholiota molesta]